ncbi:MAG: hypothetical protein Q9186_002729 [Xanthomendoza sp. 1 TL-2023]
MLASSLLSVIVSLCFTVAAASTTSTLTSVPATSTTTSYTNPDEFKSALLAAHDTYRTSHNASRLTWNLTLASAATNHAQPCLFAHTQNNPNGENLAAGYPNTTAAVNGWGEEGKKYKFDDGKFDEKTGHFTQVVWKATTSVGCGATWCSGQSGTPGWFLVCQYSPAGNVQGAFRKNVQKEEGSAGNGRADSLQSWWVIVGVVSVGLVGGWC